MAVSINLTGANEYTFRQLTDLRTEGYSVMRSPHFTSSGLSVSNLGIAALGLEVVGYDWGWISPDGKQINTNNSLYLGRKRLAEDPAVTTIEAAICLGSSADDSGVQGRSLTEYHADVLNAAFGLNNIQTMSHYARENSSAFHEVIDVALASEEIRATFINGVGQDGSKFPGYFARYPEKLVPETVYGMESGPEIYAQVPIPVVLAALFAFQACNSGQNTVFHLAGSDMVKYIDNYRAKMILILAEMACRGLIDENLKIVIVPSTGTQVIARAAVHTDMEVLFGHAKRFKGLDKKAATREFDRYFKTLPKARKNFSVSVLNAQAHGGRGIKIIDSALDIPIGQLQRRCTILMR